MALKDQWTAIHQRAVEIEDDQFQGFISDEFVPAEPGALLLESNILLHPLARAAAYLCRHE
jgi:hypothetical protein